MCVDCIKYSQEISLFVDEAFTIILKSHKTFANDANKMVWLDKCSDVTGKIVPKEAVEHEDSEKLKEFKDLIQKAVGYANYDVVD